MTKFDPDCLPDDLAVDKIMAAIEQEEADLLAAESIGVRILFAMAALTSALGFIPDLELLAQQVREDEGNEAWADHEDLVHQEGRRIAKRIVVSILRGLMTVHDTGFIPDAAWVRVSDSMVECANALNASQYTWRQRRKAAHHAQVAQATWTTILAHR